MLKSITLAIVLLFGLGFGMVDALAQPVADDHGVTNKVCPLMGDEVSPGVRLEHDGQYVYFCCAGCVASFKANPAKAIAKMSDEDRAAIQKNTICPVTKKEITDFSIRSEYDGRFVYFATPEAKAQFDREHPDAK